MTKRNRSLRLLVTTCAVTATGVLVASAGAADLGPQNVRVVASQQTALNVAWTRSGWGSALFGGYRIYVNGVQAGMTRALSAWVQGLRCGTSYTVGVSSLVMPAPTATTTGTTLPCAAAPAPSPAPALAPTPTPAPTAAPSPTPTPAPTPTLTPAPTPTLTGARTVVLVDQQWSCRGPVDLDLIKVTMRAGADAISIGTNCSGRIGRVEVDTWSADGIKVQNAAPVPHDLVIGGGYVKCHAVASGTHQDGVQAMGGVRLSFRGLSIDCLGNSNFFVNTAGSGASTPTDVVCDGCRLGPRSASTLFIGSSVRSGARSTVVCNGRYMGVRIGAATAPVNVGNVVAGSTDPRCV